MELTKEQILDELRLNALETNDYFVTVRPDFLLNCVYVVRYLASPKSYMAVLNLGAMTYNGHNPLMLNLDELIEVILTEDAEEVKPKKRRKKTFWEKLFR